MIPHELNFKTHLLEYQPGTYGDFVCAIISYSVDGFFDPNDPVYNPNETYWKVTDDTVMLRNKYPLSLRGNGYEHVENYTEFLLAHRIYNDYPDIMAEHDLTLLFNTHMKLTLNDEIYCTDSRTMYNKFYKTNTMALTTDDNFDIIFMCACNEYYTSTENRKTDWDNLYNRFKNKVREIRWLNENIPIQKQLNIGNITRFNPDNISVYGNVDEQKFLETYHEYKAKKLDTLEKLSNIRKTEIFNDDNLKKVFVSAYDE